MRKPIISFWIALGVLAPACAALGQQEEPPRVDVSISRFFGRDNPGWAFEDPADLKALREFVRGLPEAEAPTDPFFGLGGFLLSADEARCRFPSTVTVDEGIIRIEDKAGLRFFQDSKGFADFLQAEAIERGLGDYVQ